MNIEEKIENLLNQIKEDQGLEHPKKIEVLDINGDEHILIDFDDSKFHFTDSKEIKSLNHCKPIIKSIYKKELN